MPPINSQSWKQLAKVYAHDVKFGVPASESQLVSVEQTLGLQLPDLLREFLAEADGITSFTCGTGVIWPAASIRKRNLELRALSGFHELYMPFGHLLFFGDDGCGDLFGFAIHADGKVHKPDVFRWEHECDARPWYAGGLEQFLEIRLKREIIGFKIYEVVRYNCEHQPANGAADDTIFLVRARTHEEAAMLVTGELGLLPHTKVHPYPHVIYELGVEKRVRPEYYPPKVLRGPYYQTAYRCGWRTWSRCTNEDPWVENDESETLEI